MSVGGGANRNPVTATACWPSGADAPRRASSRTNAVTPNVQSVQWSLPVTLGDVAPSWWHPVAAAACEPHHAWHSRAVFCPIAKVNTIDTTAARSTGSSLPLGQGGLQRSTPDHGLRAAVPLACHLPPYLEPRINAVPNGTPRLRCLHRHLQVRRYRHGHGDARGCEVVARGHAWDYIRHAETVFGSRL